MKRGNLDPETCTRTGKTPCEGEDRDQGDETEATECQRLLANHWDVREEYGTDSPFQLPEGTNSAGTLVWNF